MSEAYSISRGELVKVLRGLGIACAGAVLTYLTAYFAQADFGAFTPIVVVIWSVVVNFCRKFIPDNR
jgi:hypothetical protein